MNRILYFILILSTLGLSAFILHAQMAGLHGDDREFRMGEHAGNKFRTTFFNDGTWGGSTSRPGEIAGEWPINSGHYYLCDGDPYVVAEVVDNTGNTKGTIRHIQSTVKSLQYESTTGDQDPNTGEWWTFLPLPGFANPNEDRVAMARGAFEWRDSWPPFWPDISDPENPRYSPGGWPGSWNGYFGRDVFNADEESYFVADDYAKQEFPNFRPDTTDLSRGGLGIRMYVRGLQWAKTAVEDALFCIFDLENIGTYSHDKMVFGFKIGNNMGETARGSEAGDDGGRYDITEDIAWTYDSDNTGASDWGPEGTGLFGCAFLESPGNPYDGIDNDNDGANGTGQIISTAMFSPRTLSLDEQIVIIDYSNFERSVTTLRNVLAAAGKGPGDTLEIVLKGRSLGNINKFWNGKELNYNGLSEIGDNLFDDNLNGIIDESRGHEDETGIIQYLYQGYRCINYFTGSGTDNVLLDERRDDGIDNDGDWDPEFDDVGKDGLGPGDRGYPGADEGEGDGIPTAGEPHFDQTDIDESDMLGLTSFWLYQWGPVLQSDDEAFWTGFSPGRFMTDIAVGNVELAYGSGYFPLIPGQIERFSVAYICAESSDGQETSDLIRNKHYVADAYNKNYNFAKAPLIPTLRAVAGDNKVTLFWDDVAEESDDPISGKDFEGYRIYRSTDPGFNDATAITNAYGSVIWSQPMAQFDIDNEYEGLSDIPTQGVQFYLGNNTGLRHYWTDTTAVNGFRYFYAVTSYDRGDVELGIDPSECTKFVSVKSSGEIEKGTNVVIIRPEAPAAGYTPADFEGSEIISGPENTAEGTVHYQLIDPDSIRDNHTYQITFKETLSEEQLYTTAGFTLVDITNSDQLDTLLEDSPLEAQTPDGLPIVHGFQLSFSGNPAELNVNPDSSGWSRPEIPAYDFGGYVPSPASRPVELIKGDFEIIFSDVGIDTSKIYYRDDEVYRPIPVNFTIMNTLTNEKVDFAFRERCVATPSDSGKFTYHSRRRQSDEIIFLADANHTDPDSIVASWQIKYSVAALTQTDTVVAEPGDVLTIKLSKPFLSHDSYTFTTCAAKINQNSAEIDLDKIRVVPNPYIVTNRWEPKNPYSTGRGERQLHFTHLPAKCTIKIFNVRGQLVTTLEHNAPINNGTEIWNMLSKDNLEISYGIYIYYVKAKGIGEKTGKFIVIK
jgi:hypothetical protein